MPHESCVMVTCLQKQPKFPFGPWTIVHGGQKIELPQKIHANRGWCEMHGNQFWWAQPFWFWRFWPFISCLQNSQNFPLDHGLSMGVKKQNRLKKFMQVEVEVKCIETKFGVHGFSGFGDFAPFLIWPYFLQTMDLVYGGQKQNWLKKFRQVEADEICNLLVLFQLTIYN